MHKLESQIILPFRTMIEPCTFSGKILDGKQKTTFNLHYDEKVLLGIQNQNLKQFLVADNQPKFIEPLKLESKCWTLVHVETYFTPLPCAKEKRIDWWIFKNYSYIMSDLILPKLNYFLLHLKKSKPKALETGVIRNVGEIDLLYYNLIYNGVIIIARGISTIFASLGAELSSVNVNISAALPKEWTILTRAVDLINHGYFLEAFVVGYALLDDMVQEFIKVRLPHLNPNESDQLLRNIKDDRLRMFLGPLMRLAVKVSPFDNDATLKGDVEWLNKKRNKIMHSGQDCVRLEAQRGLQIILNILKFLSEKGGNYILPENLEFWSNGIGNFE